MSNRNISEGQRLQKTEGAHRWRIHHSPLEKSKGTIPAQSSIGSFSDLLRFIDRVFLILASCHGVKVPAFGLRWIPPHFGTDENPTLFCSFWPKWRVWNTQLPYWQDLERVHHTQGGIVTRPSIDRFHSRNCPTVKCFVQPIIEVLLSLISYYIISPQALLASTQDCFCWHIKKIPVQTLALKYQWTLWTFLSFLVFSIGLQKQAGSKNDHAGIHQHSPFDLSHLPCSSAVWLWVRCIRQTPLVVQKTLLWLDSVALGHWNIIDINRKWWAMRLSTRLFI